MQKYNYFVNRPIFREEFVIITKTLLYIVICDTVLNAFDGKAVILYVAIKDDKKEKRKMKRYIVYASVLLAALQTAQAQEVRMGPLHSPDNMREEWLLAGDTVVQQDQKMVYQGKPVKNMKYSVGSAPASAVHDTGLTQAAPFYAPAYGYGYGLHRGLNVQLGASAFVTSGKGLPHKGGFSQTINATYLAPLTRDGKLWIAGGGYLNNTLWGGDSYRDAGLYAIVGYRFDEHWEAYAYGQLSLSNNYNSLYSRYAGCGAYGYGYGYGVPGMWGLGGTMPLGYGMGAAGANVLGAGVRYNVNKNFTIGINVEGVWYNHPAPVYFDRYNYPLPQGDK